MLLKAQDRIYLQDGTCVVAKVLEIAPDQITVVPISESGAPFINSNEIIRKHSIVLIEFKNGSVEYFNNPRQDVVSNPVTNRAKQQKELSSEIVYQNFISLNTLALCNSDISGFFEHLSDNTRLGFGLMGAYNFNKYASAQNNYISILSNGKKLYDAGAFINFYPRGFKKRSAFYIGLMFKYTAFTYSSVVEENVNGTINYKYLASKGSQLATIFTVGSQTNFTKTVFLKTMLGLGGFNLRGDYKDQYNYKFNQLTTNNSNTQTTTPQEFRFLPKIYLGLNIGFNF
jgi:hypothetical protein